METIRPPQTKAQTAPASKGVRLEGVRKQFGSLVAVDGVSVDVQPGEFFSLLGASGCGKTTLLRIIAGFEAPDAGQVWIGGDDLTRVDPQRRPTAMVFQSYALFPTMTVGENVEYGLRVRRVARAERRKRVAEALASVDLSGLEQKPVNQLSGGQQQRVALARALAVRPQVLLFDESLSNLDVALREQTRRELKSLQARLGTTSIYVTHDQQEALALSDRIAVMRQGVFQQVGTPEALYREPDTAFVARFLGGSNIIEAEGLAARFAGSEPPSPGMVLAVRPEHIQPAADGPVEARLRTRQFLGTYAEWWLEAEGQTFRAWVDPGRDIPEPLRLAAQQHRWVRAV
jgi:ABC-type Fe3+/spermidine/putrescine transport system ATPase subunit